MAQTRLHYISEHYLLALLDQAERMACSDASRIKYNRDAVKSAGLYVGESLLDRIFCDLANQLNQPDFALELGKQLSLESHGFLGYSARSCATLGDCIDLNLRYMQTRLSFVKFSLCHEGHASALSFHFSSIATRYEQFFMECVLSSLSTMLRQLVDEDFSAVQAYVTYNLVGGREHYSKYLPWNFIFGASKNKLVFPTWVLDLKLETRDDILKSLTEDQCQHTLSTLPKDSSFNELVKLYIQHNLLEGPSVAGAAEELHLSERTLKRKLKSEGMSFQGLLDSVREERTKELLGIGLHQFKDVAVQVGFKEYPSFIKAFKRWTGVTPSRYIITPNSGRENQN